MDLYQDNTPSPLLLKIYIFAIQAVLCLVAFLLLGALFSFRREVYQALVGWLIGLAIFDFLVEPCMRWAFNKVTANWSQSSLW